MADTTAPPEAAAAPPAEAAPPAAPPPAAAPAAAAETTPRPAPRSLADSRRALAAGMRARVQPAAPAPAPTPAAAAPAAPVDRPGTPGVGLGQQTPPASAPAAQATDPTGNPTGAPTGTPAPTEPAATPSAATGAPPSADAAAPAAEKAPPSDAAKPPLPAEFETSEHQQLYQRDPLALRTVKGIWLNPQLSEADKALRIQKYLDKRQALVDQEQVRDARIAELSQQERTLRERGDAVGSARVRDELDTVARSQEQAAEWAARLIAESLDLDPADPEFLSAQSARDLAALAARKSPVLEAAMGERLADREAQYQSDVATLRAELERVQAEHAAALAELKRATQEQIAQAREGGRAEVRAGQVGPPRMGPPAPVTPPTRMSPTTANARANLALGIRSRVERQEATA